MKRNSSKKILDLVNFPEDMRKLPEEKLPDLCDEVRDFLIESVSQTGGHLGSSLGVVELTVALHYVFDTPKDALIWDVGHQAYAHKIITGRKNKLNTIRQKGGLAPFPKREESEYDTLSVGHSSTSISAAAGLAIGNKNKKNAPRIVAVIGDGAISAGMAFEALNHAGYAGADMLVILNDNKMSISPNVGGMGKYLTRLISSPSYVRARNRGREMFDGVPTIQKFLRQVEKYAKGMVAPGTLFEELGFEYYGPIDGHDVLMLVEVLSNIKKMRGPKFLHVVTKKGHGYAPAEKDRYSFHAVGPFDVTTGKRKGNGKNNLTYTDIFSIWVCDKAANDPSLHCITPAMCQGSGAFKFSQKFSERYHDVGIAEQHAVTFAAGLALSGKKPVVAIYSSFLQRAYDQLIHDVAFQNLNVLFAIDRAGIVGPDGPTHAGSFDLSFMRIIPNLIIMAPSNANECYSMLEAGFNYHGPAAVRYSREEIFGDFDPKKQKSIEIGKAEILRRGKDVAILAFGPMVNVAKKAAEKLEATLVNMRFIKPLDEILLKELAKDHQYFITIEDNVILGGAGSAVGEFFHKEGIGIKLKMLGLPDKLLGHGKRKEILAEAGLEEGEIVKNIADFIKK